MLFARETSAKNCVFRILAGDVDLLIVEVTNVLVSIVKFEADAINGSRTGRFKNEQFINP